MITSNFASLRASGLTPAIEGQLARLGASAPDSRLVRITAVHRHAFTVSDGAGQAQVRAQQQLIAALALEHSALAVGDWAVLDDSGRLAARLPPLTTLVRRAPDGRPQPLASNVDTALLVMGMDHDFNPRRLERYLAIARSSGVQAVVVLTKADAAPEAAQRSALLARRLPAGCPMVAIDARAGQAAAALAPWLGAGQTLIMLGASGAGKSTLTNSLSLSEQDTGAVRSADSSGRHTTTARTLHRCAGGACIIDTPGLRSWSIDAGCDEISAAFEDIDALAGDCRFADCRHQEEPGCAVRGIVDPDRLRNHYKLLREAMRHEETPLERIAERGRWKVLHKAGAARARHKRS